jgi:hypothetical protein
MPIVKVLSGLVNNVVVLVEGRRFPGLVVQGDRLHEWLRLVQAGDAESVQLLAYEMQLSVVEFDRISNDAGLALPNQ